MDCGSIPSIVINKLFLLYVLFIHLAVLIVKLVNVQYQSRFKYCGKLLEWYDVRVVCQSFGELIKTGKRQVGRLVLC